MKKFEIVCSVTVFSWEELSEDDKMLVQEARSATAHSYAPYSRFQVGAAVRLADGTIVVGCNQENAAYPSGLCAERTALFAANAQFPAVPVVSLAVAAYYIDHFTKDPVPPCGACRQVILEIEERYKQSIRILLYGTNGVYVVSSVRDLLPFQFVGESMM